MIGAKPFLEEDQAEKNLMVDRAALKQVFTVQVPRRKRD